MKYRTEIGIMAFSLFRPPFRHLLSFVHISVIRNSLLFEKTIGKPFVLHVQGLAAETTPNSLCIIVKFSAWQIYNLKGVERGFLLWRDAILLEVLREKLRNEACLKARPVHKWVLEWFFFLRRRMNAFNYYPSNPEGVACKWRILFSFLASFFFSLFLCFLFLFVCLLLSFSLSSILLYNFFFHAQPIKPYICNRRMIGSIFAENLSWDLVM